MSCVKLKSYGISEKFLSFEIIYSIFKKRKKVRKETIFIKFKLRRSHGTIKSIVLQFFREQKKLSSSFVDHRGRIHRGEYRNLKRDMGERTNTVHGKKRKGRECIYTYFSLLNDGFQYRITKRIKSDTLFWQIKFNLGRLIFLSALKTHKITILLVKE